MTQNAIDRPESGTILRGIEHAYVCCRKYDVQKNRQTSEHHAFVLNCHGNVIVTINKSYRKTNN